MFFVEEQGFFRLSFFPASLYLCNLLRGRLAVKQNFVTF